MITIYWKTKDKDIINAIRNELNIDRGMTVNGENVINPSEMQYRKLKEFEARNYIQIRNK